ncbi:unnamed protein product [Ectocarpus sp. 13 AM-2016]
MRRSDSSTPGAHRRPPVQHSSTYHVGDGLVRGKVNKEILETVFGEALTTSIAADTSQRAVKNLLRSDSDISDEKQGQDEDDGDLTSTDETSRKLQVVVSGPSEFVANVRQLLDQMKVPSGCMVLLD